MFIFLNLLFNIYLLFNIWLLFHKLSAPIPQLVNMGITSLRPKTPSTSYTIYAGKTDKC